MTAPLGAVLIVITGKRLLNQTPDFDPQQRKSIITMAFDQDSLLSLQELNNSTWMTRTGEENDVSQPMIDSSKTAEEKENGKALQDLTPRKWTIHQDTDYHRFYRWYHSSSLCIIKIRGFLKLKVKMNKSIFTTYWWNPWCHWSRR